MNLYPTILTASLSEAEVQLEYALNSNAVSTVQVDIIDGYFADNLTLSPLDLTQLEFGDLHIDFHLMVDEPMDFVNEIIGLKEYLPIRAIIAQVERMSYQDEYIQAVRNNGWKVGLSLDVYTPVSAIDERSWEDLEVVQLMTVEAGFQGSEFNQQALGKVADVRKNAVKNIEMLVDGGVNEKNIPLLVKSGVDGVGVGSELWQAANPQAAIEQFAELLQTESDEN